MVRRARRCSSISSRSRSRSDRNIAPPAFSGPVGDPADVGGAPRLPRLRAARSPAASGARATRWSCSRRGFGPASPRSSRRTAPLEDAVPPQSVTVRLVDDRGRVPRRHARRSRVAPGRRARAGGARLLDERPPARAAREARDEAHDALGARRRRRARLRRRPRRDRRRTRAGAARAERHRRRPASACGAALRRSVFATTARPARSSSSTRRRTRPSAPAWSCPLRDLAVHAHGAAARHRCRSDRAWAAAR